MPLEIKEAKERLSLIPRTELGFFPTPLHKLGRLSEELGINLYLKRDDFTGKNVFGGNKTRKLEFLIGKAVKEKCEYIFTYGATQSNHAMQTTWAAAANNMKPILYLAAVVKPDENDIKSNLLLDKILGAEVHIINMEEKESFIDAEKRSFALGKEHMQKLETEGHKCMNIPMGGANEVGTTGYISGFAELCEQAEQMGVEFDYLYHATGSGGTMAGLAAGKKLLGRDICIRSIAVFEPGEHYVAVTAALANRALKYIGETPDVGEQDFNLDDGFYAPGYECPNAGATEAIKMLAKKEGILLDPVYTGKAFAGLIHDVRTGKIGQGSNVVFLHTGGTTALFAEKQILGSLFA